MNIIKLKHDYFIKIRNYNFLNNLLGQHLDYVILKYNNEPQHVIQALYMYKNSIGQISLYQNLHDQQRFFMNIESTLINLNNENVWIDLLSFFDEAFVYTQHIRELKELTSQNSGLIQENLDLKNDLKTILDEVQKLHAKMETTININLLQNDEILILKEMIANYQKK